MVLVEVSSPVTARPNVRHRTDAVPFELRDAVSALRVDVRQPSWWLINTVDIRNAHELPLAFVDRARGSTSQVTLDAFNGKSIAIAEQVVIDGDFLYAIGELECVGSERRLRVDVISDRPLNRHAAIHLAPALLLAGVAVGLFALAVFFVQL